MQTTVERITAQRAHIEQLERALWRDGVGEQPLLAYQSAYRELERLIAARGDDRRHHFVILIPVADSPGHLRDCLSSLLEQCRLYGYGGMQAGRYRKVSVLLADDSANAEHCERQRATAGEFSDADIATLNHLLLRLSMSSISVSPNNWRCWIASPISISVKSSATMR